MRGFVLITRPSIFSRLGVRAVLSVFALLEQGGGDRRRQMTTAKGVPIVCVLVLRTVQKREERSPPPPRDYGCWKHTLGRRQSVQQIARMLQTWVIGKALAEAGARDIIGGTVHDVNHFNSRFFFRGSLKTTWPLKLPAASPPTKRVPPPLSVRRICLSSISLSLSLSRIS